jgi:hypothetical protein
MTTPTGFSPHQSSAQTFLIPSNGLVLTDIATPIVVNGRLWGNLRTTVNPAALSAAAK